VDRAARVSGPPAGLVLVTRGGGIAAVMIRFGAALRGRPNLSNHVAVVHHTDPHGTTWAIEGRPAGVGWADAGPYLASAWTLTNAAQPMTPAQGAGIAATMQALLGTPYDWEAIAADAAATFGLTLPGWDQTWKGVVPGHVQCASAAAYALAKQGMAHPGGDRACDPGAWDQFILTRGWAA
jgi:hypothetical protein